MGCFIAKSRFKTRIAGMTKKNITIMAIGIAILGIIIFFLVRGCGSQEEPASIIWSGGASAPGELPKTISLGKMIPPDQKLFEFQVEGLPKDVTVEERREDLSSKSYLSFLVATVPADAKKGIYPIKITYKNASFSKSFESEFVIGDRAESQDSIYGGIGRTGQLPAISTDDLVVSNFVNLEKGITSPPCVVGNKTYLGLQNGKVVALDDKLGKIFEVTVSEDPVVAVQATEKYLVGCDSRGNIVSFDLSQKEPSQLAAYKLDGKASSPPTIVAEDKILVGSTDGLLGLFSLPNLEPQWKVNLPGPVIGNVSCQIYKSENGLKGYIFAACDDSNIYYHDLDGKLVSRFQMDLPSKFAPIVVGDRVLFSNSGNFIQLSDSFGRSIWSTNVEDIQLWQPISNSGKIYFFGKKKIIALDMKDGSVSFSEDLPGEIVSQPVFIGKTLCLPLQGQLSFMSGDLTPKSSINLGDLVSGWPVPFESGLLVAQQSGGIYLFTKGNPGSSIPVVKFNMKDVVFSQGLSNQFHNSYTNTKLPKTLKLKWEKDGEYAPVLTTKTRAYLYNITKKVFSCVSIDDGKEIWQFPSEAYPAVYHTLGYNETPMCLSENGLYLGTVAGVMLVDPDTGRLLRSSNVSGIPQADDSAVVVTNGKKLSVCDKNLKTLWIADGNFVSSNVIILGDSIAAISRDEVEDFSKSKAFVAIYDKLTGKMEWSKEDASISYCVRTITDGKRLFASTGSGLWMMDIEEKKIYGASRYASSAETIYVKPNGDIWLKDMSGLNFVLNLKDGAIAPAMPMPEDKAVYLAFGLTYMDSESFVGICPPLSNSNKTEQPEEQPDVNKTDFYVVTTSVKTGNNISSVKIGKSFDAQFALSYGEKKVFVSTFGSDKGYNPKLSVWGD